MDAVKRRAKCTGDAVGFEPTMIALTKTETNKSGGRLAVDSNALRADS